MVGVPPTQSPSEFPSFEHVGTVSPVNSPQPPASAPELLLPPSAPEPPPLELLLPLPLLPLPLPPDPEELPLLAPELEALPLLEPDPPPLLPLLVLASPPPSGLPLPPKPPAGPEEQPVAQGVATRMENRTPRSARAFWGTMAARRTQESRPFCGPHRS